MIPRDYITEWRAQAPWVFDLQVEQDLVISRALVAIFSHPLLSKSLALRGGTALYKLYIKPPARYSEDIDLVQINAEPVGPLMGAMRDVLDPDRVVAAFSEYMNHGGSPVSRAQFEKNIAMKSVDPRFTADIGPLLADGYRWDFDAAAAVVRTQLIKRLSGEPWKGHKTAEQAK